MVMNNSVSLGLGFVPLVGDVALAAWKSNWRNADLLEKCTYPKADSQSCASVVQQT